MKNTMIDQVILISTSFAAVVGWYVIAFLQASGVVDKVTSFDAWIGGVSLGAMVFFALRWAFKRNDALTEKIHQMHVERIEEQARHFDEIKEILKNK